MVVLLDTLVVVSNCAISEGILMVGIVKAVVVEIMAGSCNE